MSLVFAQLPDRIHQLQPEAEGLLRLFKRLHQSASDRAAQKLFSNAEESARKMLAALRGALPTVSRALHD